MKKIIYSFIYILIILFTLETLFRLIPDKWLALHTYFFDRSSIYYHVDDVRLHPWSNLLEKPRRIAIVGDSFTRGVGVQIHDRFSSKLEQMLNVNENAMPIRVDVFDEPGTSTFQQIDLVNQALQLSPELIILSICLNDTEDWTRPKELEDWRKQMLPVHQKGAFASLIELSHFMNWIYNKFLMVSARKGYINYYKNIYNPSYSGWKRFTLATTMMRDACRNAGINFVIVINPLLSDRFDQGHYPFEFAHEAIRLHLENEKIQYIDALLRFRNTFHLRMTAIPIIDPHPSEIAHRIIAETLFDFLFDIDFLEPEYVLRWRETEVTLPEHWKRAAEEMGLQ